MRATAEPLEGNKVRLSVEVDEPEVDRVLDRSARDLSRRARIPGFRPGKVPRKVLEARMGGATAMRTEMLRDALPDFYAQAVRDADVDPIAPPDIDITAGEDSGSLVFDALVEVRPIVSIAGYQGLRITLSSPAVTEADIDAQVDRLRDNEGELVPVNRPAVDGDNVSIDVHGTAGGEEIVGIDDYLYEVGSGGLVPELDTELRGSRVGDVLAFNAQRPDTDQSVSFRVLVKDVKEKRLPEATDAWAAESSEFSTIAELREDIRTRIANVKLLQAQMALREKALEALTDIVDDDQVPEVLVEEETSQRVQDLSRRMQQEGVSVEQYLAATGHTPDELVQEVRSQAHRAVKADLALRALVGAEELEVSDEEFDAELAAMAERLETDPAQLRVRLDRGGRTSAVRSEQKKAKALTWLIDHVEIVDEEGNEISREELRVDAKRAEQDESAGDEPAGDGQDEDEGEGELT